MTTIYLDASALSGWSNCREFYRRQQVEKIEPARPNIYYHYGTATHLMVEAFWRGEKYEQAMAIAYDCLNLYPVDQLNPSELETWERMVKGTPELCGAYFNAVTYSPEQLLWVEKEWSIPYEYRQHSDRGDIGDNPDRDPARTQVVLCGRMDRVMVGPRIVDVKTASEIATGGIPWKAAYRQDKILDLQFALYDWYLCQMCKCGKPLAQHGASMTGYSCEYEFPQSMTPIEIYLEVLLKPYRPKADGTWSKPARYEKIDLNQLITPTYRKRFAQQLKWKVSEIVHYVENYSQQKPWPLAGGLACSSKYGKCAYQELCSWGDSVELLKKYKDRVPHLEVVRGK